MDDNAPALHPELVPIESLTLDPKNARLHGARNLGVIGYSLGRYSQVKSIVVNRRTMTVVAGNGTITAALEAGATHIVATFGDWTDEEAVELGELDNRSAMLAEVDVAQLAANIGEFPEIEWDAGGWDAPDFEPFEVDWPLETETTTVGEHERGVGEASDGEAAADEPTPTKLVDTFGVPPFSVLDARRGYWQTRKREWLALGIKSEVGRGGVAKQTIVLCGPKNPDTGEWDSVPLHMGTKSAIPGGGSKPPTSIDPKTGKWVRKDLHVGVSDRQAKNACPGGSPFPGMGDRDQYPNLSTGKPMAGQTARDGHDVESHGSGTSIFDPVLTEILVRWFSPKGGHVLDPFAGGSVRGVVAGKLGRQYTGLELRPEQVEANRVQAEQIGVDGVSWVCGDSAVELDSLAPGFDMILSCPPYYDLEVYSDLDEDISALKTYEEFLVPYREIIAKSVALLAPDSFACFVVGDMRDKKGFYRNFVADTVRAFEDAGARLYNDAILVTALGSLPLRAGSAMKASRKLGKTHQNILVFYRGNPKNIRARMGELEAADICALADSIPEPTVSEHEGVDVLRDDLVPGGSKRRFVEAMFEATATEVIYAGPSYGAAQLALALGAAAAGKLATLFLAERKEPTDITAQAIAAGANVIGVSPGYLTNVKAKAKAYAAESEDRQLLPFGFDCETAYVELVAIANGVLAERGQYDQIWCVAGSGFLARCIIAANEEIGHHGTRYHIVQVGKEVDVSMLCDEATLERVTVHEHDQPFEKVARVLPPYPSAAWYDAKLWEHLLRHRSGRVFVWNVMGPRSATSTPTRRVAARDGDKRQARRRVQTLIDNGSLPKPADVTCADCEKVPAREYDHHLGYGADHHEDVVALCASCHHKRELARAKAGSPGDEVAAHDADLVGEGPDVGSGEPSA